jgi:hypothetical protein
MLEIFLAVVGTAMTATILGVLTTSFVGSVGVTQRIDARAFPAMRIATLKCSTAQTFLNEQYRAELEKTAPDDPLRPLLEGRIAWLSCLDGNSVEPAAQPDGAAQLPGAVLLVNTWDDAVRLLADGQADAVLGDWVALTYLSRQSLYNSRVDVQPQVYRNEPYGWAIARRPGSDELRTAIDSALIAQMRNVTWRANLEAKLGAGSVSPN